MRKRLSGPITGEMMYVRELLGRNPSDQETMYF